jgi:hypothetical protein
MHELHDQKGIALVTVLLLVLLLMSMLTGYFTITYIDQATIKSSLSGVRGLYSAEGGLNLRAEDVRQLFLGYSLPTGTSPVDNPPSQVPCQSGNDGSGDMACVTYSLFDRSIVTYVEEPAGGATAITIPSGEIYQNKHAIEFAYIAHADAQNTNGNTEARLEMHFKSRLVPMFQFAAFYGKDLEILPTPAMTLGGAVHTNGDLYVDAAVSLDIAGPITTGGDIYRGNKHSNNCDGLPVRVPDPGTYTDLPACSGRTQMLQSALDYWNGMIRTGVSAVTVPGPSALAATAGNLYWDRADLRIVLDVDPSPVIEIRTSGGIVDSTATGTLTSCAVTTNSSTLYNHRESAYIDTLDVDVQGLLDCIHNGALVAGGLGDATDGGLVLYFTVDGPNSGTVNEYGVRLINGDTLASTVGGAPAILGLTVVSDQAVYIQGDYNSVAEKPAAVLADSINVLSNNWNDSNSPLSLGNRIATNTTVNAGFLAGTDTTGGIEGSAGQDLGNYGGGLENFARLHEHWSGVTFTYRGSFVSLNNALHVNGAQSSSSYSPPIRAFSYESDFDNPANLPPLPPTFVYLKQDMFVRDFGS